MAEVRLDFNFSPELVLNLRLLQLRLEEDLQCHDVLAPFLPGQVHVPELPFTERPSDVEILQRPPVVRPALQRKVLRFKS